MIFRNHSSFTALSMPALVLAAVASFPGLLHAEPVRVTEVRVERTAWVQPLSLSGTLTSLQDATLTPRVGGLVTSVRVDAGARVSAGDVLVELDRTLDDLMLQQLQAELEAARGELAEAVRLRDENLPLAAKGLVPTTEAEASKARVQIRSAEVARLEAQIKRQRERIARHRVIAPFDGVIRQRYAEVGEWVDTGDPVADLVSIGTLRLDVQVPQEYFALVREGMPVAVRPDALNNTNRETRVSVKVPVNDATARTFLARIQIDNRDGALAPGMSAQAVFRMQTGEEVLVLPRDATLRYPDGSVRVWVIGQENGDNVVSGRQVRLGRSNEGLVEIREGLEAGERVVLRGNESLQAGARVEPVDGD